MTVNEDSENGSRLWDNSRVNQAIKLFSRPLKTFYAVSFFISISFFTKFRFCHPGKNKDRKQNNDI
jgi:hypothetical protein